MKKTLFAGLFLLLAVLASCAFLASCGNSSAEMDIHALADDLIANAAFEDELTARRADTVAARYGLESFADQATFATGGATAEEIAIFEGADEKEAESIFKAMQNYLSSQIRTYDSYNPAGVVNLEAGYLDRHGKYVIYCVCADPDSAKTVIESFLAS